jgi:probable HAF family extracellular repeat protein
MRRFTLLMAGLALVAGAAATVTGGARQAVRLHAEAGASAQARWVVTDLGASFGGESEAFGINRSGSVVGYGTGPRTTRPLVWVNRRMTVLAVLPRVGSGVVGDGRALAINDRGAIVGTSSHHAVRWQEGRVRDLGSIQGFAAGDSWDYRANAINNRGTIVGWMERSAPGTKLAFVYRGGAMVKLCKKESVVGPPSPWDVSRPPTAALNSRGDFVGTCDGRAFVWRNGHVVLLRVPLGTDASDAAAINEQGMVAGKILWPLQALVWRDGRPERLPVPSGGFAGAAEGINDAGDVVGIYGRGGYMRAVLWRNGRAITIGPPADQCDTLINERGQVLIHIDEADYEGSRHVAYVWDDGTLARLPTLGGAESAAYAINENNQIAGWATTKKGKRHAVLWTLKRG